MVVALVEYWVGGWVGKACRLKAGGFAQSTATHHIRQVNHTNNTWAPNRDRDSSFEETLKLLNLADKSLSPIWTVQQNSNVICKKKKKDQRISYSAGGVKSRVNLLNSISTLVNFKGGFSLLTLAVFPTAAAVLTLTRNYHFHEVLPLNNDFSSKRLAGCFCLFCFRRVLIPDLFLSSVPRSQFPTRQFSAYLVSTSQAAVHLRTTLETKSWSPQRT